MSEKVTSLGARRVDRENDNGLWSPLECLRDAVGELETGERKADCALVLFLDKGQSGMEYNLGWHASRLHASEMLALLDVARAAILADMGY